MKSLIDFFNDSVAQYGNNTLIWEKTKATYSSYSYNTIKSEVYLLAKGLLSLGVEQGERVALLSEGRKHWLVSELAILHCAAINVPLSTKLDADADLVFRINHSEAKIIICSVVQLAKIRIVKQELPLVSKIIVIDSISDLQDKEITLASLIENSTQLNNEYSDLLTQRISLVTPDTHANISYTSGTTSDPKGIILTHRNYTANVEQAFSFINIPQHYRTLVVLPWDHAFAHTAALYSFMHKGASIASVQAGKNQIETLKNFTNNIQEIQPDILMSVPAMAKNFKKGIVNGIAAKGLMAKTLFKIGLRVAYFYNGDGDNKGRGLRIIAKPLYAIFNAIIFNKIKLKFGGNLKFFIGGGALLDIDLQRFFYAIGIPMYQGYGLTEAAPIISANTPRIHKLGSSGQIVNNLKVNICDSDGKPLPIGEKGEIVIQGENVMKGYWKNEKTTKETLVNNWLHTGDMGYLTKDNYLYVLGRFKSLLIGADGEKYSPEGIEEAMIDHCPLIEQLVLHNSQNPYTVGLVVLNKDKVQEWLKKHHKNIENPDHLKETLLHINHEIQIMKKSKSPDLDFPSRWFPSAIAILPEAMTESNKLINSTMKVVRSKVEVYFESEIKHLYTPEGKDFISQRNINNFLLYFNR